MTAPVVCRSKTINLVHYQWLFKEGCDAVDEKCMLLLLWYSCQACKSWISFRRLARLQLLWCSEYCDEATTAVRSSSWMKRQHSKYDNMILHYRQKKIHCCCATLRHTNVGVYQHQQPTKNQQKHAHARVDPTRLDDRREGGGEDARYVSLAAPCVHYQKSDHLFCKSLFVPPSSRSMVSFWIFCMKCISKIRAKNFQVHTSLGICNEILQRSTDTDTDISLLFFSCLVLILYFLPTWNKCSLLQFQACFRIFKFSFSFFLVGLSNAITKLMKLASCCLSWQQKKEIQLHRETIFPLTAFFAIVVIVTSPPQIVSLAIIWLVSFSSIQVGKWD